MSTGVIIAVIVIVAVVVLGAAALSLRARAAHGGGGLKRRFGPEYDRAVARHDGDAKAAERDLAERVKRHGGLHEQPLEESAVERYEARWTAAQERFVDSPRDAVTEADRLLAEVAGARGFPDGGRYEEQLEALSVHHARHVHGYRRLHRAAYAPGEAAVEGPDGTEEMREAMIEARALFEDLMTPTHRHTTGLTRKATTDKPARESRPQSRSSLPWAINRRHAKGS